MSFIFISLTFPGLESDQGRFDKIVIVTVDVKAQDKTGHVALLTGEFLVGGKAVDLPAAEGYCSETIKQKDKNTKLFLYNGDFEFCMASSLRTFQSGGANGWGEGDVGGSFLTEKYKNTRRPATRFVQIDSVK